MMELTGEIPGLLRDCSPVRFSMSEGNPMVVVDPAQDVMGCILVAYGRAERVHPANLLLDTRNPTGRFHARLWLAERGHDVGNEDRAEVLAWSVLSVSRGGKPLAGVAGPWSPWGKYVGCSRCFRPMPGELDRVVATLGDYCVWGVSASGVTISCVSDTGEGGQAAADAALLRLGWALTNPDGTLTLPPLPGAK